jgi:ferrous iron transport protein B
MRRKGHGRGHRHRYGQKKIILLGNPNVGKSVIFGYLTGKYVTVSNYPGTTVELTRGMSTILPHEHEIIDTPGINSLIPQSEDEQVTRNIILEETCHTIVQVADAKNLARSLYISLQLAEAGIPFVLNLNMIDEAKSRGIVIDTEKLSQLLHVHVTETIATQRKGMRNLVQGLIRTNYSQCTIQYLPEIEKALEDLAKYLPEMRMSKRFIGLMLLSGDTSIRPHLLSHISTEHLVQIDSVIADLEKKLSKPVSYYLSRARSTKVEEIISHVMKKDTAARKNALSILGKVTMHPVWGIPFVLLAMFITYLVVGVLGAGICVDFLEEALFGKIINPFFSRLMGIIPVPLVSEFFVGEYGVITMAFTYAVAIVLPIVGFFFLIFGILEDSGYLPRLAIMVNRIFKVMGLNGKAVLPMILGLGCDTMATMTARILPTKKERIIVTLLLALAVPCSAQLGIIFGATASISLKATAIWAGVVLFVIFVVGFFSSKFIPGESSDFILEIPPLRIPEISNILIKTFVRIQWYLKEAVPMFILGSIILFLLSKTGLLLLLEKAASPLVVHLLHLPREAASGFIMGFLRRDYAIVLITKTSNLSPQQLLVGIVTITLFVPCVANLIIMIKERGIKVALFITGFIFTFAFLFGALFNYILTLLQVVL